MRERQREIERWWTDCEVVEWRAHKLTIKECLWTFLHLFFSHSQQKWIDFQLKSNEISSSWKCTSEFFKTVGLEWKSFGNGDRWKSFPLLNIYYFFYLIFSSSFLFFFIFTLPFILIKFHSQFSCHCRLGEREKRKWMTEKNFDFSVNRFFVFVLFLFYVLFIIQ